MKLARTSLALLGLALGLGGCRAYATFEDVPLDCTVDDGYEFNAIDGFDLGESPQWFGAGDPFCGDGGVDAVPVIQSIEGGGRCGSTGAAVFRAKGCNDWGALYGNYAFGSRDESAYEGVSFWARAPGNTAKAFSIALDDTNTLANADGSECKDYGDGGSSQMGVGTVVDPATGQAISGVTGAQPLPDQCGNQYAWIQVVTADWRFYTIPFERFTQSAQPNRVPNAVLTDTGNVTGTGLLTSALRGLGFRMPKESQSEFWIDDLNFYRHKRSGADAGSD